MSKTRKRRSTCAGKTSKQCHKKHKHCKKTKRSHKRKSYCRSRHNRRRRTHSRHRGGGRRGGFYESAPQCFGPICPLQIAEENATPPPPSSQKNIHAEAVVVK